MIAEHGISRSAQAGRLQEAVEVVCRGVTRTKLDLNLANCEELKDVTPLAKLGELQSLQELKLNLSNCRQLVDVTGFAKLGDLQSLQKLELNLMFCSKLPENLQKLFTNDAEVAKVWGCTPHTTAALALAEFAAACKGGADGHEGDDFEWPA